MDAIGAVAMTTGADHAAAVTAEAALPLVEARTRREVAGDAVVALTVAGEPERAAALREAEGLSPPEPIGPVPATRHRPAMLPIPPGEFTMGSPAGEAGRFSDEQVQRVELTRGFLIAETEVTQAQYAALMGANPSRFQGTPADGSRPVESVNWLDVVKYCNALSKAEGFKPAYVLRSESVATWDRESAGYRLPTEAEWEYAARAGASTATYEGKMGILGEYDAPALDAIGWYGGNSDSAHPNAWDASQWQQKQHTFQSASTHPVKRKRPNGWGLYDTLGNVSEWTGTSYIEPYSNTVGRSRLIVDPVVELGELRVIRGGSFGTPAGRTRLAARASRPFDTRSAWLGFRPVRWSPRDTLSP